jgi:hypothetical protein
MKARGWVYKDGPPPPWSAQGATIYKGKNLLLAKPLRIKLTEVLNVPGVG